MVDREAMKAYSEDLRQKVVEAVEQRGTSKSEAARLFGISPSRRSRDFFEKARPKLGRRSWRPSERQSWRSPQRTLVASSSTADTVWMINYCDKTADTWLRLLYGGIVLDCRYGKEGTWFDRRSTVPTEATKRLPV
jgi:transposase-like protein